MTKPTLEDKFSSLTIKISLLELLINVRYRKKLLKRPFQIGFLGPGLRL